MTSTATWERVDVRQSQSRDALAAVRMLRRLAREEGYSSVGPLARSFAIDPECHVWVLRQSGRCHGCAVFGDAGDRWTLNYAYVTRSKRRKGHLASVWAEWNARYGEFSVLKPSPAMQSFLAKHGASERVCERGAGRVIWQTIARRSQKCGECREYILPYDRIGHVNDRWSHVDCAWGAA